MPNKSLKALHKYDNSTRSTILKMVSEGYTEEDICKFLMISRNTLHRWKGRDLLLTKGIESYKHLFLKSQIEKAALAKAIGLTVDEVTEESIEIRKRKDGSEYPVKVKKVRRQLPPDTKMLEKYMKKVMPELEVEDTTRKAIINIENVENMTFRELLEYNKESNAIDAEYQEVEGDGEAMAAALHSSLDVEEDG